MAMIRQVYCFNKPTRRVRTRGLRRLTNRERSGDLLPLFVATAALSEMLDVPRAASQVET
jgi:hypothetical protein